ncbi:MAG TPA: hypothetical protein VHR45_12885 [Thermoanaerobaculia bacterium]|nr:hypothetical protein [Thermoanaerobaculia bacterium]
MASEGPATQAWIHAPEEPGPGTPRHGFSGDHREAALREAERCGRREAEAFERALSERERRELENRLCWLAMGADDRAIEPALRPEEPDIVLRLQRDIDRLSYFHRAVLKSRAWIVVQRLRRPFGRAW